MCHYHEKVYITCLNFVHEYVNMITQYCDMTILVGNHDMSHNQIFCDPSGHWLNVLKQYSRVTVVDTPRYLTIDGFKFAALPYVYPGRFKEAVDAFNIDLTSVDYCICHQEFKGCQMGAIESKNGDEYTWNTQCISGHIHSHQVIGNVFYTGAAFEHTFGSDECFLFFLKNKNLEKIKSQVKAKHILHVEMEKSRIKTPIPSGATPQFNKCVITVERVEDFHAWLASEQGRAFSKAFTIEFKIKTNSQTTVVQTPNVVKLFVDKMQKYPECAQLMNKIL